MMQKHKGHVIYELLMFCIAKGVNSNAVAGIARADIFFPVFYLHSPPAILSPAAFHPFHQYSLKRALHSSSSPTHFLLQNVIASVSYDSIKNCHYMLGPRATCISCGVTRTLRRSRRTMWCSLVRYTGRCQITREKNRQR